MTKNRALCILFLIALVAFDRIFSRNSAHPGDTLIRLAPRGRTACASFTAGAPTVPALGASLGLLAPSERGCAEEVDPGRALTWLAQLGPVVSSFSPRTGFGGCCSRA